MGTPLSGADADVYMAASPSVNTTNETCDNTDSGAYVVYEAHTHKFWDRRQTLTVQCSPNGSTGWSTVTDYTFAYAGGVVTFKTARTGGVNNFVRISTGYYFNLTELDDAVNWSLSFKGEVVDTTAFQSGGWARNTATIKKGSGKIDTVRTDGRIALEIGSPIALQLYMDLSSNDRWDAIAIVSGLDVKSDAKGILEQSMSFDIDGDCTARFT